MHTHERQLLRACLSSPQLWRSGHAYDRPPRKAGPSILFILAATRMMFPTRPIPSAPQRRFVYRDQVLAKSLTDFKWTSDDSAAHRRAAGPDASVKTTALKSNESGHQVPLGVNQGDEKGASQATGREPGGGLGGNGPRTTASGKVEPGGFFNKFGSGKILPVVGGGGTGAEGGDRSKKRRGTHDGVIATSEREPAANLIHFKPRVTDSADQVRGENVTIVCYNYLTPTIRTFRSGMIYGMPVYLETHWEHTLRMCSIASFLHCCEISSYNICILSFLGIRAVIYVV